MPYDQFLLFGDSITQQSSLTFAAALQNGSAEYTCFAAVAMANTE